MGLNQTKSEDYPMINNMLSAFIFAAAPAPTAAVQAPVECIYAATAGADRLLVGGLAARGGGQRTEAEASAIGRLLVSDTGCKKAFGWSARKSKAALDYARAKFLRDYGRNGLAARKLPFVPVERTFARLTPAMRTGLLSGSVDTGIATLLGEEIKKAGLKPAQVNRDDARLMGNMLAAMAAADKARADFEAA